MTLSLFWSDFKSLFDNINQFVDYCESKWGNVSFNEYGGEDLYCVDLYDYYPTLMNCSFVTEMCQKAGVDYVGMVHHQLDCERTWRECTLKWN